MRKSVASWPVDGKLWCLCCLSRLTFIFKPNLARQHITLRASSSKGCHLWVKAHGAQNSVAQSLILPRLEMYTISWCVYGVCPILRRGRDWLLNNNGKAIKQWKTRLSQHTLAHCISKSSLARKRKFSFIYEWIWRMFEINSPLPPFPGAVCLRIFHDALRVGTCNWSSSFMPA